MITILYNDTVCCIKL